MYLLQVTFDPETTSKILDDANDRISEDVEENTNSDSQNMIINFTPDFCSFSDGPSISWSDDGFKTRFLSHFCRITFEI